MKRIQIIRTCFLLVFLITSCKNEETSQNFDLLNSELLRGEIVLCSGDQFGEVSFTLSCNNRARKSFNLGISLLHSFEYDEAEKAFVDVIDQDPDCVMAYWGVAMCNFHALWRPPSVNDLKKGSLAIQVARSIPHKSEQETDYIEAIGQFYKDWEQEDHQTRVGRFEKAMEELYKKYPNDKEVAIFYSLALNSAADLSDKTYKNRRKAGAILEKLFLDQANHPGIAHYIIHSYDYPELAHMALPAARRYADIAPSSAHAQHMPSHIFTRLGLWEESIKSNLQATSAAQCYSEQAGMNGNWDEEIHGLDYLVYAYLQTGNISEAQDLLDYFLSVENIYPVGLKGAYPSAAIPTRIYLETKQWDKASKLEMAVKDFPVADYPWPNGIIHFGRVLGAAHTGDLESAENDLRLLAICHEYLIDEKNDYMADQVLIMVRAADAWIQFYKGNQQIALTLMKESADLESRTEKQSLTPGEVLPAQELLADLYLALGMPSEALKAYELNLKIRPNRFNSLYGAAVAAQHLGNEEVATDYFEKLIGVAGDSNTDRPELETAKSAVKL